MCFTHLDNTATMIRAQNSNFEKIYKSKRVVLNVSIINHTHTGTRTHIKKKKNEIENRKRICAQNVVSCTCVHACVCLRPFRVLLTCNM